MITKKSNIKDIIAYLVGLVGIISLDAVIVLMAVANVSPTLVLVLSGCSWVIFLSYIWISHFATNNEESVPSLLKD